MPKGIYLKTQEQKNNISLSIQKLWGNSEYRQKQVIAHKGLPSSNLGKKASLELRLKLSEAHKKNPTRYWLGKKRPEMRTWLTGTIPTGKKHWNYQPDRNLLKKHDERADSLYTRWRSEVLERDKECKLKNEECAGYRIVHHILSWREYLELRYETINGIVLCQYHHPQKRIDEQRLISTFQMLVGSNNY